MQVSEWSSDACPSHWESVGALMHELRVGIDPPYVLIPGSLHDWKQLHRYELLLQPDLALSQLDESDKTNELGPLMARVFSTCSRALQISFLLTLKLIELSSFPHFFFHINSLLFRQPNDWKRTLECQSPVCPVLMSSKHSSFLQGARLDSVAHVFICIGNWYNINLLIIVRGKTKTWNPIEFTHLIN